MTGCMQATQGNQGLLESYPAPLVEAGWIRNGEPIVYDGHQWYPVDDVENLLDSEVFQIGEHKDVQIFVEKIDAKPYDRILTKFSKAKYRYFERRDND